MWEAFYQVACQTAVEAGQLLRQKWHQPRQLQSKGFRDIVTDADFASQTLITQTIRTRFPNHGFLTEETDQTLPMAGDCIWIIDPLDGTNNYSRQLVNYSVSIAVAQWQDNETLAVIVGAIYDPMQDELFSAIRGQGSWLGSQKEWQGQTLTAAPTAVLNDALFAVDWSHNPEKREQTLTLIHTIAHHVRTVRAIGSAALALAWIAAGRIDGYLNLNLKPWDVAAGALLINEAGGQISAIHSNTLWHLKEPSTLATNSRLHKDLQQLIYQTINPA